MQRLIIVRLLKWLGDQIDTMLALLLGAVCSILGILGIVQSSILASATLGTLTVLAFALMRDRLEREKIQKHLSHLAIKPEDQTLDTSFRQNLDEAAILWNAEQEVWMAQETGAYIIETQKAAIVSFLKKGGILKIVVTSPREDIRRQLAFRNHDFPYEAIENRFQIFRHYIDTIINSNGLDSEKVQVRFIPYSIDASKIIVDPENAVENKRKAIIRYPGFRSPFEDRLGILVQGDKSPDVFSYFFREMQRTFQYSYKVLFLIDSPHSSKNSFLLDLVKNINNEEKSHVYFLHQQAIITRGEVTGFELKTSNLAPTKIITQNDDINHVLDTSIWVKINSDILDAYSKKKIIVLDEISSFQLADPNFLSIIETILKDPNSSVFARIVLDEKSDLAVKKLRLHYRSTVLYLSTKEHERSIIKKVLHDEMRASLFTAMMV